jgi:itaconyl-CoA hydratase
VEPLPTPTHREVIGLGTAALAVGAVIDHCMRRTITDFDNIAASLLVMNTHPVHSDYDFAERTRFKKPLVVSPFLLSCIVGAVTDDLRQLPLSGFNIRDLRFVKPVHPGDTIAARSVVESVEANEYVLAVTGLKADGAEFARFRLILTLDG